MYRIKKTITNVYQWVGKQLVNDDNLSICKLCGGRPIL